MDELEILNVRVSTNIDINHKYQCLYSKHDASNAVGVDTNNLNRCRIHIKYILFF